MPTLDPEETYVFLDIEADGPIPGLNSMLAIGLVAYTWTGEYVDHFYAKLTQLPGARVDQETEKWWRSLPRTAYVEARRNAHDPMKVMSYFKKWYHSWIKDYPNPVLVANPIHFDGAWLRYYAYRYLNEDVFGGRVVRCIDVHSMAIGLLGGGNRKVTYVVHDQEKPHHALKDVEIQAKTFFALAGTSRDYKWSYGLGMDENEPILKHREYD